MTEDDNPITSADWLLLQLGGVCQLSFAASSNSAAGWNAVGEGDVLIETATRDQVIFREFGRWKSPEGREFRFRNVYRWSRTGDDRVRLEHLRMGAGRPVLLFDLEHEGDGCWRSVNGHQCKEDCYSAELRVEESGVRLEWLISGLGRRDVIGYDYRSTAAQPRRS
ncbi:MAG: DUF6314 family protein [Capsulimonas sp.]|uniref:DUF6314 family protein n=1 Tax=Capsulimonas sp. TaxID=2494211 RepID=UPI003264D9A0